MLIEFFLGYIGEFEEVDDHRNGKIVVQLNGRLNKTGVISPRYNVQLKDLEKWVVKLLPSRQFGCIVLTTSAGIMDRKLPRSLIFLIQLLIGLQTRRPGGSTSLARSLVSSTRKRVLSGHSRGLEISTEVEI